VELENHAQKLAADLYSDPSNLIQAIEVVKRLSEAASCLLEQGWNSQAEPLFEEIGEWLSADVREQQTFNTSSVRGV
jgi:hypothetical protein